MLLEMVLTCVQMSGHSVQFAGGNLAVFRWNTDL